MKRIIAFFILTLFITSCSWENDNYIYVHAASSFIELDDNIKELSPEANKVQTQFMGSGMLAMQIAAGADADIFISANREWLDYLQENDYLIDSTIKAIAKNRLVIISNKNSEFHPDDFTPALLQSDKVSLIAMGDPEIVPAGKYATQFLEYNDLYQQTRNKCILTKDVVSAYLYAEVNECDFAIVYKSVIYNPDDIKLHYTIPEHMHEDIYYYIAMVKGAAVESKLIYDKICSEGFAAALEEKGFEVADGDI